MRVGFKWKNNPICFKRQSFPENALFFFLSNSVYIFLLQQACLLFSQIFLAFCKATFNIIWIYTSHWCKSRENKECCIILDHSLFTSLHSSSRESYILEHNFNQLSTLDWMNEHLLVKRWRPSIPSILSDGRQAGKSKMDRFKKKIALDRVELWGCGVNKLWMLVCSIFIPAFSHALVY